MAIRQLVQIWSGSRQLYALGLSSSNARHNFGVLPSIALRTDGACTVYLPRGSIVPIPLQARNPFPSWISVGSRSDGLLEYQWLLDRDIVSSTYLIHNSNDFPMGLDTINKWKQQLLSLASSTTTPYISRVLPPDCCAHGWYTSTDSWGRGVKSPSTVGPAEGPACA